MGACLLGLHRVESEPVAEDFPTSLPGSGFGSAIVRRHFAFFIFPDLGFNYAGVCYSEMLTFTGDW